MNARGCCYNFVIPLDTLTSHTEETIYTAGVNLPLSNGTVDLDYKEDAATVVPAYTYTYTFTCYVPTDILTMYLQLYLLCNKCILTIYQKIYLLKPTHFLAMYLHIYLIFTTVILTIYLKTYLIYTYSYT